MFTTPVESISADRLRKECDHLNICPNGLSRSDMISQLKCNGVYNVDLRFPAKPKKIDTSNRKDDLSNVYIGNGAGKFENRSNRLCIANSDTSSALISGDFKEKIVNIDNVLNIQETFDFSVNTFGKSGDIRRHKNKLYMYKERDEDTYEGWYEIQVGSVLII